jgi:hypothetical protein
MENVIEIRHYVNRAGKDVFDDWLTELADAKAQAKGRGPNQSARRRKLRRLQIAASRFV